MPERVVYLEKLHPIARELVQEVMPPDFTLDPLEEGTQEEALLKLKGVRTAIVATFPITPEFLAEAPSLKFIQAQGVGLDNFNREAIRSHGALLALNPAGFEAVAEMTVLLMLAACRRLPVADRNLRAGKWERWSLRRVSHDLVRKTVGLAGLGRNGRAVARRLQGFGVRVIFTDVMEPTPPLYRAKRVSEAELLAQSDVLSLHLPLNRATHHWLDAQRMDQMKPGAIVINTSRGDLLDEDELILRLNDGRVGAAGLDVYSAEPPGANNPLWGLDNVVVTPHISAGTRESYQEKMVFAFDNIRRYLQGKQPLNLI